MINLPLDEAYCFDYLAILYVKRDKGMGVDTEIDRVESAISEIIGAVLFKEVTASPEFCHLVLKNEHTFDAVVASGESPVQIQNRERFLAKKSLQARFWPDRPITEKKRKGDW